MSDHLERERLEGTFTWTTLEKLLGMGDVNEHLAEAAGVDPLILNLPEPEETPVLYARFTWKGRDLSVTLPVPDDLTDEDREELKRIAIKAALDAIARAS